jgi:hypothetical protein
MDTASVADVYREYLLRNCGPLASHELSGIFASADDEGWFRTASSPEYYAYTPMWGRLDSIGRGRLHTLTGKLQDVARRTPDPQHRATLEWYIADCRFMLLLDDVGKALEPAYRLRKRLRSIDGQRTAPLAGDVRAAREGLDRAPVRELFAVYASRVRSRGELGVLSSLNQKLYNEYTDLLRFLSTL